MGPACGKAVPCLFAFSRVPHVLLLWLALAVRATVPGSGPHSGVPTADATDTCQECTTETYWKWATPLTSAHKMMRMYALWLLPPFHVCLQPSAMCRVTSFGRHEPIPCITRGLCELLPQEFE
jgi:hypothetical protein